MHFAGSGNEDDEIVFDQVREVKETIARMLSGAERHRRGENGGAG